MPGRFKTECKKPGCHNLTDNADGYCDEHQQECKPLRRYDDKRGSSAQRGYGSRWRRYRIWFLKHHPVCAVCGRLASVVDHIVPHKGNVDLFWDSNNHQTLCKRCHDIKTAREDGGFGNIVKMGRG